MAGREQIMFLVASIVSTVIVLYFNYRLNTIAMFKAELLGQLRPSNLTGGVVRNGRIAG